MPRRRMSAADAFSLQEECSPYNRFAFARVIEILAGFHFILKETEKASK